MDNNSHLIDDLKQFGLTQDEATIYLELLKRKNTTAYKLSKKLKMSRTKVYSLLDILKSKNLVSENTKSFGSEYIAHPYKHLEQLVEVKEAEIKELKETLPELYKKFSEVIPATSKKKASVLHYYGMKGLKQVVWNTLRAEKEFRIYEVSRLSAFMQQEFAENVRREYVKRGIVNYDLTNQSFMPGWTDVKEFVEKYQKIRYIDPKILTIRFEIYIYNDVVAMVDYKDEEIFCIEITNPTLAQFQTQLFDYVWSNAQKMYITGERGQADIKKTTKS